MLRARTVIFDGDMGGDDLWAMAILAGLHKAGDINLIGITTCFGNTTLSQATQNAFDFLDICGCKNISIFKGADGPISGLPPLLDGAFGSNGLSLATLQKTQNIASDTTAVSWMADQLKNISEPITIINTGPSTNIAKLFRDHPDLDRDNIEILWFGGSLCPAAANHLPVIEGDGEPRIGNITKYAEFNAINDTVAAQIITDLNNVKLIFIPMDATHHMDISLSMITGFLGKMRDAGHTDIAVTLSLMMYDVAVLDEDKFNSKGCYAHDAQVILYMTNPELFLNAVPITDVSFVNDTDKVSKFDAIASGFNFSLLGRHGQMKCIPTNKATNKYIVPGLTSFTEIDNVTPDQITAQHKMMKARWDKLCDGIVKGVT